MLVDVNGEMQTIALEKKFAAVYLLPGTSAVCAGETESIELKRRNGPV